MKAIPDFPNYSVTKTGKIWSHRRNLYLKSFKHPKGYNRVTLWRDGKKFHRLIHRLVLETYISPCPKNMECCHANGNPADNRLENLRWDTTHNNNLDAFKHKAYRTKLTEPWVKLIYNAYHDGAYTQQELADMFYVSIGTISMLVNNKTWKHVCKVTM